MKKQRVVLYGCFSENKSIGRIKIIWHESCFLYFFSTFREYLNLFIYHLANLPVHRPEDETTFLNIQEPFVLALFESASLLTWEFKYKSDRGSKSQFADSPKGDEFVNF